IADLAIIENLEVIFEDGLNIITGETGAGKSILVSSLRLILGHKPDPDLIRAGSDKMTVEAEFAQINSSFIPVLASYGIETDGFLIIRREVWQSKRSRIFINDSPSTIKVLSDLGKDLVDIHGQHDHQALLNKDTQISIIDNYSGIDISEISVLYHKLQNIAGEIEKISQLEKELTDKRELLNYQLEEIREISPSENEDGDILLQLGKMENIEKIKKLCFAVEEMSEGDEHSILQGISMIKSSCDELSGTDKKFEPFLNDLESSYQAIKEFSSTCSVYAGSLEFDEKIYNDLSNRYSLLKKLNKKFGPTLSDVIRYENEISVQLDSIENIGSDKDKYEKQLKELESEMKKECSKVSSLRKSGAVKFESAIKEEFKEVGLNDAELSVKIDNKPVSPDGSDSVEFYIRTNIGEESKPLSKTASGGEVSRIMLSVKNIAGPGREAQVSVFDEIDSGISGRIAEKVGSKISKLSKNRQVIVITHLPAIASKSGAHFSVRKRTAGQRTLTEVIRLSRQKRVDEIASLITTEKGSSDSKKLAEKMLED
ncbi:MAG: DNA repair protein RecN, partial [Candidatus Delongbacteria bacterium]